MLLFEDDNFGAEYLTHLMEFHLARRKSELASPEQGKGTSPAPHKSCCSTRLVIPKLGGRGIRARNSSHLWLYIEFKASLGYRSVFVCVS